DEADPLRLRRQTSDGPDQERALLLLEAEADEVGWNLLSGQDAHVDAGELHRRELERGGADVVGEDEADAEDQDAAGRDDVAKRALAVGAVAGLDVANPAAEHALGPEAPLVGAVVERLAAAPADVEHQADPRALLARRALGSRAERAIGEERDVGRDEGG